MTNLNENILEGAVVSSLFESFEPPENKEKHYYIRGKFATIETVNNNKRFYPRALWEREVAKYQEVIKTGSINTLMEWDHPEDRLEVDPIQAIGKITNLWIDGNYVMGEAVIFDTPKAEVLKSMIKHGVQISVSSRARGRVDSSGVVQEFDLITFDFVAKPSDKSATMYGLYEKYMETTNESRDHNLVFAHGHYLKLPESYRFISIDENAEIFAHRIKPRKDKGIWDSGKSAIKIGFIDIDKSKIRGDYEDFMEDQTKKAMVRFNGTLDLNRAIQSEFEAYGLYYASKKITLLDHLNEEFEIDMEKFEDGSMDKEDNEDAVLESLVRQVRTKDSIIDDLKDEIEFLRESKKDELNKEESQMNEAKDFIILDVDHEGEKIEIPASYKFISVDWDGISVHKEKPKYDLNNMEFTSKNKVKIVHLYWNPEEIILDWDPAVDVDDLGDDIDRHWETIVDWAENHIKKKGLLPLKNGMKTRKLADIYDGFCDDGEIDSSFDIGMLNESDGFGGRPRRSRNTKTFGEAMNETWSSRNRLSCKNFRLNESSKTVRYAKPLQQRLMEGDIVNPYLDYIHEPKPYDTRRHEEEREYHYRRSGEGLSQTHRHQDHTLLRDTDPASSSYSGEAEVLKIARLLQSVLGRDNTVGTVLDRDIDTGLTVRGYAADIEETPRFAENGLDFINKTLSESYNRFRR